MPSAELLWAYLLAISLLTVTPGVDTLLVMRNTARGGLRDGVVSSLGICSGLFVHATLSAVGISLILLQTAWAFTLLKWVGAAYLVWLGVASLRQAFRSSRGRDVAEQTLLAKVSRSDYRMGRSLREGLLSNVLNPKTALFYMAFLPQFIDPAGPAFAQSIALAAIHFVLAMIWQTLVAMMIVRSRQWSVKPMAKRVLHGLTGGVFMAIGAKLAVTQP
ncbi:LysE family translocator [Marinobacter nanhaiticus D15-8W]|uniref:LysE family translocator n=1 Tax=Marinobacter nanhaiticus D15-8W TaxID=626887 RepID=N6W831_9GAMM|nr:LysE family translocator [Marinobacter nanhaiticus]ENO16439.1 LysE family translocator [Marinobacter nanhaiticus D15-8W]BES72226.1 LysE family translocator [Marinobacter nanhaiticus D15-8W]